MQTEDNDNHIMFAKQYLDSLCTVLQQLAVQDVARVLNKLEEALVERRQVFLVGNGGSSATASHMVNDLVKGVAQGGGPGFRAISLSDNVSLITAIANDDNYKEIFASQLAALAQQGDVLIVISGSGNSPNIIRVLEVAQELQLTTLAFLGMGGGQAAGMADLSVIVPSEEYGPIEDVHMVLNHLIITYLRDFSAKLEQETDQ